MNRIKKITLLLFLYVMPISLLQAQESENDSTLVENEAIQRYIDSIANSFTFQKGEIQLGEGIATLMVPENHKYLDPEQSKKVLSDLWGNPPSPTLGMLFPENANVLETPYAIDLTYSEEGYIEDGDAEDLDYEELLSTMQEDTNAENPGRKAMGYEPIQLVGWASPPFYDASSKKLHWAKELKFGESEEHTLNYEVRVLGRKGFINMNVISDIQQLPVVKTSIPMVVSSVNFNDGYRYADFNPDLDRVAAYGIGGLIAGKVLAKTGLIAILLKFWKLIAVGALGLFGAFRKKIFGTSAKTENG